MRGGARGGTTTGGLQLLLLLVVVVAAMAGRAAAERGTSAADFGLVGDVKHFVGLLLAGELFSLGGLQKHNDFLQHLAAEGLSLAIIAGSAVLKVPQIMAILGSGNVVGLSLFALYFELVSGVGAVLYNVHAGNPFSVYGEAVFILVQNLLLLHLLWSLAKPPVSTTHKALAVGLIGGLAAVGWWLPEHKEYLVMLQAPLLIAMKLPQLATNFRNGHTGQLALLTVVMGLGGTLIRVFTTYKKLGPKDPQLFMYAASALLNLLLFAQMLIYYRETQRVLGRKSSKGGKATRQQPTRRSTRKSRKED